MITSDTSVSAFWYFLPGLLREHWAGAVTLLTVWAAIAVLAVWLAVNVTGGTLPGPDTEQVPADDPEQTVEVRRPARRGPRTGAFYTHTAPVDPWAASEATVVITAGDRP